MSGRLDGERWRLLSPLLDEALDVEGEERAAWLAALRARDAALAAEVEALLGKYGKVQSEGFLEAGAPALPPAGTLAGQTFGAYTLRECIGHGGMGSVWLGGRSDGRFEGVAAVKLLNAGLVGNDGEARFRREGSILARLHHPHIAQLSDAGVSPLGQPYLVLEYVDGQPIDVYCDERSLSIEARLRLFLDVLAAVSHAHANLIVHRDIKPSNVLVDGEGRVKLLDFGIAKLLEHDGEATVTALTRAGEAILTPDYAAPEQLTGGHVTTATDVYALGVLLYLLLSGHHPYRGASRTPAELVRAILEDEPPRVSAAATTQVAGQADPALAAAARRATTPQRLRGRLQGDLDTIVARALKKAPAERYPSVEALAADLRRHLGNRPVLARRDSVLYRARKFARRNRTAVELAALVVVAAGVGLAGTLSQARRAREQATLAEAQSRRADEQARAAEAQRDFALRQLSRAEAVNDLNVFLLTDSGHASRPLTAAQLLNRAYGIIQRQQGEDENRVSMLIEIGQVYEHRDEVAQARRVLTEAYELARTVPEPSTRGRAACALANTVRLTGEGTRAEELIQEGLTALAREPQYGLYRVFCLLCGSRVARERGDVGAGIERAEAAGGELKQMRLASNIWELHVAQEKAESYRIGGRHAQAAEAFEQVFARLTSMGRDETEMAAALLNNWGLALAALGRILEAERHLRRSMEMVGAGDGAANVSPTVLANMARVLRELHRLPESARLTAEAEAKARASGDESVVNQVLIGRAALHRELNQLDRSAAALAELEPRLVKLQPPGHIAFANLASEKSLLAAARGDAAAARAHADHAVALAEANARRREFLPRLLLRRAEIAVAGAPAQAAADAGQALSMWQEGRPADAVSSWLGLGHLARARARQALGDTAGAALDFAAALRHLEPCLGRQHPATRAARESAGAPGPSSRR